MSQLPEFLDYESSAEEYWRCSEWPALAGTFQLNPGDMPKWHDAMAGQGRAWDILRLLFRVAPTIGKLTEDDLRAWNRDEIRTKLGISLAIVDGEINNAIAHWKQQHAEVQLAATVSAHGFGKEEFEELTRFSSIRHLPEGVADGLLSAFNFDHITDETLKAEIANRIISLKSYLSSPNTRTIARQIIRMEISMHGMEGIMVSLQNSLDEVILKTKTGTSTTPDKDKREIESYHDRISDIEKQLREIAKAHSNLLEQIGADEIDLTARKRLYVETVAYLMEQCRIYESDPENILMDGVWTANEIEWKLQPLGKRLPQYRPDVAIRIREALTPENLWNPEYKPTPIQRRVQQELLRMVKFVTQIPEDAPPLPELDEEDDEETVSDGPAAMPAMDPVTEARTFIPAARQETPALAVF